YMCKRAVRRRITCDGVVSHEGDVVLSRLLNEKHQVFNAAGEELSAAKPKMMLLDSTAEG
nr:hypothetical protein [Tanacetum cinerariifolium]